MKLVEQLNTAVKSLNESSDLTNKVIIQFRNSDMKNEKEPNWFKGRYALNSKGDGWFRNDDKYTNSEGYGLMVLAIDRINDNYINFYNGSTDKPARAYKASLVLNKENKYNDELKAERNAIWLVVAADVDLGDVQAYIQKHKHEWVP